MNILYKLIDRLAAVMTPVQRHDNHYGRPTGAALRNPADPIQAARIEAAAVKRARRAEKLTENTFRSSRSNPSHVLGRTFDSEADLYQIDIANRLNPFYVAK